ncbi:hypothetical protein JCM8208_001424 [Rhodotorula glutinis]
MSSTVPSRRVAALLGGCVLLFVVLVYSSGTHKALSSTRFFQRLVSADGTSPYAHHVAHPSEEATLPLVASVASFSRLPTRFSPAHVAVCAVATHEEQCLPEWLTWHRLVGVERFYLFDNAPSLHMRRLLRPWIQEGSVVLYELGYQDDVEIGSVYQNHVLRLCERDVLPVVPWASHHDVDEFLLADAPGWTAPLPTLVEPNSSSETDVDSPPTRTWTFPLHARFDTILDEATCVPLLRLPFQNYGIQHLELNESVTDLQTVRDRVVPDFHTYGKIFIHSRGQSGEKNNAGWMGPHSCRSPPGTVVLDSQGKDLVQGTTTYPYAGLPLPQEGLLLFHYVQRSVDDCYHKFNVVSSTPNDWRTRDGLEGCARNYVPLDAELASPESVARLEALPQGKELVSRPDSWRRLFVRDTRARDSWQGRMTRAVLEEWRRVGGDEARREGRWYWELGDDASDERLDALEGIISVKGIGRALPP